MDLTGNKKTVREIVIDDYRTADVFKKWGVNYCCGGNLPLDEACALQNIDKAALEEEIKYATKNIKLSNSLAYDSWPIEFLVDYIVHVHHAYLHSTLPVLKQSVASFINGHAKKYPYLVDVQETFQHLVFELEEHTHQEEESLFPYVKQINNTFKRKEVYGNLFVRTMRRPLSDVVNSAHTRISHLLLQLREQTNHYTFAAEACANHQVMYRKLKELDDDLVQHKHLENNVLFPKVLAMEKSLLQ